MIIIFAIVFIFIGTIIGASRYHESSAILLILIVSVLWAFAFGPWGIATFIELLIGYGFVRSRK